MAAVALSGFEVLPAAAVKVIEPLGHVFDGVTVHDIEQHADAQPVRGVDEVFEILGRAEAVAGGEEGGDVVAEGAVVGVLLHGHELHEVVAERVHTRQHFIRKLSIAVNAGFFPAHTHMRLVDEGGAEFGGVPARVAPRIGLGRFPDEAAVVEIIRVLLGVANPGRDAVAVLQIRADDMHLHPLPVLQRRGGQPQLPHARGGGLHGVGAAVPAVEVSDEPQPASPRRPLAVDPLVCPGIAVESHAAAAVGKGRQRAPAAANFLALGIEESQASPDVALKGSQPAVCQHQSGYGGSSHRAPSYTEPGSGASS